MKTNLLTEYLIHGSKKLMSHRFNVLLTTDRSLYGIVFDIKDINRLREVCRSYIYYSEPYTEFEVDNINDSFWESYVKMTYSSKDKIITVTDVDDDEYKYLKKLPTTKRVDITLDDFIEYAKIPREVFRRK